MAGSNFDPIREHFTESKSDEAEVVQQDVEESVLLDEEIPEGRQLQGRGGPGGGRGGGGRGGGGRGGGGRGGGGGGRGGDGDQDDGDNDDNEVTFTSPLTEQADCNGVVRNRQYFRSDDYEDLDRAEKLADLWCTLVPDITANPDTTGNGPADTMWKEFPAFFTQDADGSFERQEGDALRANRVKSTHTQGLVAQVEWQTVDNSEGYTGIYASGSDSVVMRLSETSNIGANTSGLKPSVAFKFLLDGRSSENLVLSAGFRSSGQWNFLAGEQTNRVPAFDPVQDANCEFETVHKQLLEGSRCPYALGLGQIGNVNNDATRLSDGDVHTPHQIDLVSPLFDTVEADLPLDEGETWFAQLQKLISLGSSADNVLYQVFATVDPFTSDRVHIANIVLKSNLYSSQWGDHALYFKHDRIQYDRDFQPRDWRRRARRQGHQIEQCFNPGRDNGPFDPDNFEVDWPITDDEAAEALYNQLESEKGGGCPFAWLLD